MMRRPPRSTLLPYRTLFRSYGYMDRLRDVRVLQEAVAEGVRSGDFFGYASGISEDGRYEGLRLGELLDPADRKSTRLNSSHAKSRMPSSACKKQTNNLLHTQ